MTHESELLHIEQILFNEPVTALQLCRGVLNHLRDGQDPQGFVQAANLLSLIEDQLGESVGARAELLQALAWCRQHQLTELEPVVQERLGREAYTAGEYRQAALHWLSCLDQCRELGGPASESGMACIGLGHCCSALGENGLALAYHRLAQRLIAPLDDIYLTAKLGISLAWDLRVAGQPDEAWQLLEDALRLCRENGFNFFQAELLLRLAEITLDRGQIDQAEQLAEEGLSMLVHTPSHWCEAKLLGLLATINAGQDNLSLAFSLIQHALRIAEEDKMTHVEAGLCAQAADYAAALGQLTAASHYRERGNTLAAQHASHWHADAELLDELRRRLPA
ncbi:hypothetical protein [Chitinilyticum aquatile]|uniref:hypothetical protein n=1 Tax=Chitinilyticum aquatile TaxID=362520 RepID=UPI000408DFED|nr:hypothetical protein [Chitinilyticum aquatile]